MARIILKTNPLMSRNLIILSQQIIQAQQTAARLRAQMDAYIAAPATIAVLEDATGEAQFPAGTAAALNNGVTQIKTALDGLASLIAVIDQG
jgi:hypothetical protein